MQALEDAGITLEDPTAYFGQLAVCEYPVFEAGLDAEGIAAVNTDLLTFAFAAQTVIDSSDPNVYGGMYQLFGPETLMQEVVGDGADNLPDQVIPNQSTILPFGGTEPLAAFMGIGAIDASAASGLVRFTAGSHGSPLDPADATTPEAQTQIISLFSSDFLSGGAATSITVGGADASVIAPVPAG